MHCRIALHVLDHFSVSVVLLATLRFRFIRCGRRAPTIKYILVSQQALGDVALERIPPLVDALPALKMTIVDMIKPFVPSFQPSGPQGYDPLTKPAPEPTLPVSSNLHPLALLQYLLLVLNMMVVFEVRGELLAAVEYFGTLVDEAGGEWELAAPGFDLVVLSVFVAFPVVFGAEGLAAGGVGAAVGAGVAFFVFSGVLLV